MLQSIQYCGSGPPTYVYSKNAVGLGNAFFHVFAAETRGYDAQHERKFEKRAVEKEEAEGAQEQEEYMALEEERGNNLQEVYQKEYGKRESFLWKQR